MAAGVTHQIGATVRNGTFVLALIAGLLMGGGAGVFIGRATDGGPAMTTITGRVDGVTEDARSVCLTPPGDDQVCAESALGPTASLPAVGQSIEATLIWVNDPPGSSARVRRLIAWRPAAR